MTKNNTSKNRKRNRLKITNIDDFKNILIKEENIEIDNYTLNMIEKSLESGSITYRADNLENFIDYIKNTNLFKVHHDKLVEKISKIKKLHIKRVEFERIITYRDDVSHMIEDIEYIKNKVSKKIKEEDSIILSEIENELNKDYIYAKDIELLKKMLFTSNPIKNEHYDEENSIKTLSLEIKNDISYEYIPANIGSIEYHHHIRNNIPRMMRLIKNIDKYMLQNEDEIKEFNINQTSTLQDTMNIAIAYYDNKEFKAVSGSNYVEGFCKSPDEKEAQFTSSKVNKLGQLGVGYNRVNDSEKKILEEIHKQIKSGNLKDDGDLILYSKWQPCPSCYYVISQFSKLYPNVNININYIKEYGE